MIQGVIDTNTGELLRFGRCDFVNDGSFDPQNESVVTSLPDEPKRKNSQYYDTVHVWDGSSWSEQ